MALQPGESRQVTFLLGYHENDPQDKFDPSGSQFLNKKGVLPVMQNTLSGLQNVDPAMKEAARGMATSDTEPLAAASRCATTAT